MVIVDNGGTLNFDTNATVICSKNMGGSSGFSRGMIYAIDSGATHVILNDDDAKIEPESVFRLLAFLRLSKNPDLCVSGIMLDESRPDIVYEAGAVVENSRLVSLHRDLDVNDISRLPELMEGSPMYCNWTLFCAPCSLLKEKGLSLPLFIREDDVEFGLRCNAMMTTLPGFHVWHHTYPKRYVPAEHYYYVRNHLVALCSSSETDYQFINDLIREIRTEIAAYRYECAEAMIEGMEDYLRGPEHVFSLCKDGIKKIPIPEKVDLDAIRKAVPTIDHVPRSNRALRILTLNGVLLPSVGNIEADPSDIDIDDFFRAGKVVYCTGGGKGIVKERNLHKIISLAIRVIKLEAIAKRRFPKLREEYIRARPKYSSEEFWRSLLEIDQLRATNHSAAFLASLFTPLPARYISATFCLLHWSPSLAAFSYHLKASE